ncbi:MAG: S-ribosylhomocysteine lyase [Clostridia bacterium]|nr:S-ribosylhomocysteine lyase [Clostridia bacterium]
MKQIASFSVDHDHIVPGVYLSRIDGDITTYDLRTRKPNCGDLMDNSTMHTCEHMLATFLRNSRIADSVIYFGPMGCQTGFYLLVRDGDHQEVLDVLRESLQKTIDYDGPVFGASRKECGNYISLDLEKAKAECARYLDVIKDWESKDLVYP